MIDQVSFLNDDFFWPILIGAVILLGVFIWKEYFQSGKRNLLVKMFLALIAVASLTILALKPAVPVASENSKGILLTEAYKVAQLDSLEEKHKNIEILKYDPQLPFQEEVEALDSVFVLGRGVKAFDLWQLDNVPVIYLGGSAVEGIPRLSYQQELTVGENLIVHGLYNKPKEGNRLVLQGAGGIALDSVSLVPGDYQKFQLQTGTKVVGNFLFSLLEKDSLGRILLSDPVPVKVKGRKLLKILVLNSFPTFETKYLKNFLAERGHELLVRSQITRNRYKFEYFNTERIPLGAISEEQLTSYDLLIIDAASLRSLTRSERNALETSVRQQGLGVFIQSDESFFTSLGDLAGFSFIRDGVTRASNEELPGIEVDKHPFLFQDKFTLQDIHASNDKIFSGFQQKGRGRIGTSVIENSWKLILEGNSTDYQQLWSLILEKIDKKANSLAEWESVLPMGIQNEPFHFRLRTAVAEPEIRTSEGSVIPLERDVAIPSLWKAKIHPRQTGWNKIILQQDTTEVFEYYVTEGSQWKSLESYKTMQENSRYFENQEYIEEEERNLEPVNLYWFLLIFILGIGGLWLEPKIS